MKRTFCQTNTVSHISHKLKKERSTSGLQLWGGRKYSPKTMWRFLFFLRHWDGHVQLGSWHTWLAGWVECVTSHRRLRKARSGSGILGEELKSTSSFAKRVLMFLTQEYVLSQTFCYSSLSEKYQNSRAEGLPSLENDGTYGATQPLFVIVRILSDLSGYKDNLKSSLPCDGRNSFTVREGERQRERTHSYL